jgi:Beta-propeller repeat
MAPLIALLLTAGSVQGHGSGGMPPELGRPILAQYASLPLRFELAASAAGERQFVARGADYALAVSRDGIELANGGVPAAPVHVRFVNASAAARVDGVGGDATRIHRLHFGDGRDEIDMPAYERVAISNLHPGIDIAFHGHGREVEYDIVVAAGADPSRFTFRIDGSDAVAIDAIGDLTLATPAGTVRVQRPLAYQEDDAGIRRIVACEFALDGEDVVHLRLGDYDATRTLVIDPVVSYATYLGGNNYEQGMAVAVDAAGNAYVAGYTASTDFPLANAFDRSIGRKGDVDVFVTKLNTAGTGVVWSTYLGGSASSDRAVGIAVDATGSVYITGTTSGADFPTTSNAWQPTVAAGGFVTKLAPAGNALAYSTYVANANPSAIAVDATGSAYVTGSATSGFITTPDALRSVTGNPAGSTGFVLKLNAGGTAPIFATFLGGTGGDDATSVAIDAQGNAFVGGWTTSPDFPVHNAFQPTRSAGRDAFVAKLASDGSRLVYSTLLGGALDDAVNGIVVDASGDAFVVGETYSWDFPVKSGFQMQKAGQRLVNSSVGNAFVAKLAPAGNALVYASFLGGEVCQTLCQLVFGPAPQYRADTGYGIAIDAAGHAYVTGIARSYTFPLVDSGALRKQEDNQDSAFVAKVAVSGGTLLWSTFVRTGFSEPDNKVTRIPPGAATAVATDPAGAAYVTGDADSGSNFQPTSGAFQGTSTIGPAAIVAKFAPAPAMSLATSSATSDTQTPVTLTAALSGPPASGSVDFMDGPTWIGRGSLVANTASATLALPAGIHVLSAVARIPGSASDTASVPLLVDVSLVCN